MAISLEPGTRGFRRTDFTELDDHYGRTVRQIHVMAEFAEQGLTKVADALLLALAYNRHAAADVRRRLRELIGDDANGVMVLTCHSLAMRLVGASFSGTASQTSDSKFEEKLNEVMAKAIALLQGDELEPEEAEESRTRLLAGFRWILVDEYQDIGDDEYRLISALAGRTASDADTRLTLFAVGDDDQNIYSFNGTSPEFIRRFEQDYDAKTEYLIDNYRSSGHIRRRQRGLLLLTAHRAKGLEFDHVAVLDGGWDRRGRDEDADAPRRLYYVAMTRAKQTLTLSRLGSAHPFGGPLQGSDSVLWRRPVRLPPATAELGRSYRSLTLRDVYLSFPGRKPAGDRMHRSIAALSPGDPLQIRHRNDRWEILDLRGVVVGVLAGSFEVPNGMRCVEASVSAIATWGKNQSDPQYTSELKCDRWEVVIPDLVFEPGG